MKEEIKLIPIDRLIDHPKQAEIYGELKADPELVASIADRGVLQPLIVASPSWYVVDGKLEQRSMTAEEYNSAPLIIVSGHRRKIAAIEAGLTEIPCIEKMYLLEEEITIDFLHSNQQRSKTKAEKKKEFFEYKQVLCQIGQLKNKTKAYADKKKPFEEFSRFLLSLNIDAEKPLDSDEIIENATGVSVHQNRLWTRIFDDNLHAQKFARWEKAGLHEQDKEIIFKDWDGIRNEVDAERMTEKHAHDALGEMFKQIDKHLGLAPAKKKKSKGRTKPKAEKQEEEMPAIGFNDMSSEEFNEGYEFNESYSDADGLTFGFALEFESSRLFPCIRHHNGFAVFSWEALRDAI